MWDGLIWRVQHTLSSSPVWCIFARKTPCGGDAARLACQTFRVDQSLLRLVPTGMQAINIAAVSRREVARSFDQPLGSGLSERSVVRYRASLSSFFAWCVRERLIGTNPVTGVPVPRSSEEQVEMRPWTEDALEAAHRRWQQEDARLADIVLLLGWTGLLLPPAVGRDRKSVV